jgi:transcriptional regulator with XRE-family HTH domain
MPNRKPLSAVLGDNALAMRKARGMSQPMVAAATKRSGTPIDQTTIGRIERAANSRSIDNLAALARGLGVEPWQLLVPGLDSKHLPTISQEGQSADELELLRKYRAASPRWRMALQHLASLRSDQQEEVSEGTLVLLAKAAAEPVNDERVERSYGKAPHTVHESDGPEYRKR